MYYRIENLYFQLCYNKTFGSILYKQQAKQMI